MVDVEAVQAGEKGLLRLEVVLKCNPTTGRGAPEGEIKLALPPTEGKVLPDLPCLVCHCNVSSEWRVLIVGEDVRKHGLKVTPLIADQYFLVGQREDVGLLFEMAACPIFCLAIKQKTPLCPCRYIMYVTLTDLQNGDPVYLTRPLSGALDVALCELTYYHQFYNISAALKNNQIRNGPTTIPDGYNNICELDKLFQLLNAELTLHSPTGRLQLSTVKRLNLPVI